MEKLAPILLAATTGFMPADCRRTAVISDVHGNIDALKAVFADIRKQGVTEIVCLGDIVGYGAAPGECVRQIAGICQIAVLGNHEAMTVFDDVIYLEAMPAWIKRGIEVARSQLSPLETGWLQQLPLMAEFGSFSLVHSSFHNPRAFPYLSRIEEAGRHLAAQPTDISFHGHSHAPVIWEARESGPRLHRPQMSTIRLSPKGRYSINPGSVGQPRDGDTRASYVIYNSNTRDVVFRRVPYDIDAACRRIAAANIPEKNAERLRKGV